MQLTLEEVTWVLIFFAISDAITFALRVVRESYIKKKLKGLEENLTDLVDKHNSLMNEVYEQRGYLNRLRAQMFEVAVMQQNEKDTIQILELKNVNGRLQHIKQEGERALAIRKHRAHAAYHNTSPITSQPAPPPIPEGKWEPHNKNPYAKGNPGPPPPIPEGRIIKEGTVPKDPKGYTSGW